MKEITWPGSLILLLVLSGCSVLPSATPQTIERYVLAYEAPQASRDTAPAARVGAVRISPPYAHGAYDTPRMAYVKKPHALAYYSRSVWADAPPRLLLPLLIAAVESSGRFTAVFSDAGGVVADYRLDTELLALQQDFTVQPSRIRITLRAQLLDTQRQQLIASRVFEETEPADSEDAYGGVQAINRALSRLLAAVSRFVVEAADT